MHTALPPTAYGTSALNLIDDVTPQLAPLHIISSEDNESTLSINHPNQSFLDNSSQHLICRVLSSPIQNSSSPSPLVWDQGWNAGHFFFDEVIPHSFASDHIRFDLESGDGQTMSSIPADEYGSEDQSSALSDVDGSIKMQTSSAKESDPPTFSTPLKSSLVPTAAPFVFHPKSSIASSSAIANNLDNYPITPPQSISTLRPILSSNRSSPAYATPSPPELSFGHESSQSYLEASDQGYINRTRWSFNERGVSIGSNNPIAPDYEALDDRSRTNAFNLSTDGGDSKSSPMNRRGSLNNIYTNDISLWQERQLAQQVHPDSPTARFALPSFLPNPLGSRILPIQLNQMTATTRVQQPDHHRAASFDRVAAVAQLSSYFGPSSVEISPQAFESPYNEYASSSQHSSPTHSLVALYQTDPDDVLYTQARQTFVQQSLVALSSSARNQSLSQQRLNLLLEDSRASMMSHFDRAMHSLNPLATLYGLTDEATRLLLVDPESSGISPDVLRLAGMRSVAQMNSMGVAGLAGPSANNRKLGLYKTELCRNWEEKGSCRYGSRCQYAHGNHEARDISRHPKFKTEVCRTFWQSGSCGYGKRCCFIHTTVPGGAQSAPLPENLAAVMNGTTKSNSDNIPEPVSRLSQRMSSIPPSKGFGPNLASYLAPAPLRSDTQIESNHATSNPNEERSGRENGSNVLFRQSTGVTASNGLGMNGLTLGGMSLSPGAGSNRFTNNPTEVPPQFQKPPQSRLQRLSAHQARLDSPFTSYSSSISPASTSFASPASSIFTTMPPSPASAPLSRDPSNGSYSTTMSISSNSSSSTGSAMRSPFLERVGSNGSISSIARSSILPFNQNTSTNAGITKLLSSSASSNSSASTMLPLQSAGNDWLGSSGHLTSNNNRNQHSNSAFEFTPASSASSALDWSHEQLDEDGEDFYLGQQLQSHAREVDDHFFTTTASLHHNINCRTYLESAYPIDRSNEPTPLGPHGSSLRL